MELADYDADAVTADPEALGDLLGGPANTTAAAALTAAMEEAIGGELVGMEVFVWNVTGTDESLVVLEVDDTASEMQLSDEASAGFLTALIDSAVIDIENVTWLALNYRGEGGADAPGVITFALSIEDLRRGGETGEDISESVLIQVTGAGA